MPCIQLHSKAPGYGRFSLFLHSACLSQHSQTVSVALNLHIHAGRSVHFLRQEFVSAALTNVQCLSSTARITCYARVLARLCMPQQAVIIQAWTLRVLYFKVHQKYLIRKTQLLLIEDITCIEVSNRT
jgi:hypothetical protein